MRSTEKQKLVFGSVVYPTEFSQGAAVLLAESIRAFAGSLADAPIWFLVPEYGKKLSSKGSEKLKQLGSKLLPFEVDPEILKFPFIADVLAAEFAEVEARQKTGLLAWLGSNTVVLKEPKDFLLKEGVVLGYRPVHHTLIGSLYEKPLDLFWTLVYDWCGVPQERIFPMTGHIDGKTIRPYFNAGYLILRREGNLFGLWRRRFFDAYRNPDFQEFYARDERYAIFMHQAILSGVILSLLEKSRMVELPPCHNYPLHLYGEDVTANRPGTMADLVTVRHEGLDNPEWMRTVPMQRELRVWLEERI